MRNGWYLKYLESKSNEFQKLIDETKDFKKQEEYTNLKETYDLLMLKLLFQKSINFYADYSMDEILDILKDEDMFLDCSDLTFKIVVDLGKKFNDLEPIPKREYHDVIDYSESTILIKEFLKEQFGRTDASIFENFFIKNRRFVLQDIVDNEASVTVGDNELYIVVPGKDNISKSAMMAHEAGHVKRLLINSNINQSLLGEFESITYEVRFLLWLIINDIHAEDAKNLLLNTMRTYENCSILHYLDIYQGLFSGALDNAKLFKKKCHQLDLFKKLEINNYQDLADLYGTACGHNYQNYLVSFLTVVKELPNRNYLDRYH